MSDLFGTAEVVAAMFYGGPMDGTVQTMTRPLPREVRVAIPVIPNVFEEPAEPESLMRQGLYVLVKGTARYGWAGER